jgi:hypothetical protein
VQVQEVIQRLAYRTIPRDLDPGSRVPHETTRAMNVDRAALHGRAILIKTARTPTVNDERREQLFRVSSTTAPLTYSAVDDVLSLSFTERAECG